MTCTVVHHVDIQLILQVLGIQPLAAGQQEKFPGMMCFLQSFGGVVQPLGMDNNTFLPGSLLN